jgi:exodeoxyribonuclease V beta subunit
VLSGTTVADAICSGDVPLALRKPVTFLDVSEPERNGRAPGENSGANKGTKAAKSGVLAEWICSLIRYLTTAERGETPIRIPTEKSAPSSDAVAYRNIALGDICILVERHGEAKPIMKLFRRNGVPYTKQRNTGLFASDECLHLLAVLEAIDKSDDAVAVKKALLTRFFGWRPADIGEAFEAVSDRWSEATKLLRRLSDLRGRKQWGTLFAELFRSTGLFSRVANDREPALRIAAYRQLRTYCLRSLIDKRITLAELVARLRLLNKGELSEAEDEDVFHRETEGDAVQILTMFSAKGLEFPIVFVVGGKGEDRPASNFYSAGNKDGGTDFWLDKDQGKEALRRVREQEIRRLYYVALTRAKYRLFVPLWDHSDEEGNVPGRDRSSASALFLSRLCCAVLAKKENEPSFSLLTAPVFPSCIDAGSKAPSSGAGLFSQGVAIGEWRGENGSEVAPPAGRGTILESYSGMVRMAGKLGIRTNPGADEDHGVSGPQAADAPVEQESDVLVSSAETGDALHAILEEADFAEWAQAACIDKLIEPGSAAALLVERSLGARGIIKGDGNDGTRKRRAAELARNSLLAAIEDPCGKGTIALAALKKAERMSEAEFYFTFDKNGKPFPPAGADPGGWVLGFIDFLFRTGDRYYLLDWKSNRIASGVYNRETIGENMEAHRYDVQYKVYSLALHNWLAQRVPSYDPARHLGGIIYVYLRGTSPGLGSGIWSIHPSREDLETVWPAEIEKRLSQRLRAAPGGRL